jgi:uncharacterized membrane protein
MESGMTLADYSVLEKVGNRHRGVATTGLALGAVALGVGIIGTVAVGWGVNAASKARSRAAEQLASANQLALQQAISNGNEANRMIASLIATERSSREAWQSANQPTLSQVIELQNNPSLQSTVQDIVSAMASAQAIANNNGINSAVGGDNYLRTMLYSAPQPCACPGCNG